MIDRYCSHIVITGDRNTLNELYKHTKKHQPSTINQGIGEAIEWYIETIGKRSKNA